MTRSTARQVRANRGVTFLNRRSLGLLLDAHFGSLEAGTPMEAGNSQARPTSTARSTRPSDLWLSSTGSTACGESFLSARSRSPFSPREPLTSDLGRLFPPGPFDDLSTPRVLNDESGTGKASSPAFGRRRSTGGGVATRSADTNRTRSPHRSRSRPSQGGQRRGAVLGRGSGPRSQRRRPAGRSRALPAPSHSCI